MVHKWEKKNLFINIFFTLLVHLGYVSQRNLQKLVKYAPLERNATLSADFLL